MTECLAILAPLKRQTKYGQRKGHSGICAGCYDLCPVLIQFDEKEDLARLEKELPKTKKLDLWWDSRCLGMKTIFFILTCLHLAFCLKTDASDSTANFASKYKKAKTEAQKRTVCIDAIDAGVIYEGSPIDDVKKVFAADFRDQGFDDKEHKRAIVHFVPPKQSPVAGGPAFITGWYLSIIYRADDGTVVHYHLSNESKSTSFKFGLQRQLKEKGTNADTGLPVPVPAQK